MYKNESSTQPEVIRNTTKNAAKIRINSETKLW